MRRSEEFIRESYVAHESKVFDEFGWRIFLQRYANRAGHSFRVAGTSEAVFSGLSEAKEFIAEALPFHSRLLDV